MWTENKAVLFYYKKEHAYIVVYSPMCLIAQLERYSC